MTQTQVDPGYSPDELGYAGGDKAILTTLIHGNPSDVNAERFAEQVLTSMNRVQVGASLKFGPDAGPGGRPMYKVVMVFNPESQVIDSRALRGTDPAVAALQGGRDGTRRLLQGRQGDDGRDRHDRSGGRREA